MLCNVSVIFSLLDKYLNRKCPIQLGWFKWNPGFTLRLPYTFRGVLRLSDVARPVQTVDT